MNEVKKIDSPKIWRLQALMSQMPQIPQAEIPTYHYFCGGMYARVLKRPKNTLIVGKVHKKEHFYIVTKGTVEVASDEGSKIFHSGDVIVSEPGTKRAVLALEDSICMTIHFVGQEKNLDQIEKDLIEEDKTAMFDSKNLPLLETKVIS